MTGIFTMSKPFFKNTDPLFQQLPGFVKTPPGLERVILRWILRVLLAGAVLLALPSLAVRMFSFDIEPEELPKLIHSVDIFVTSIEVTFWTAVFTVFIGAVVVMIMKGPAYVADAYPLSDSEFPAKRGE